MPKSISSTTLQRKINKRLALKHKRPSEKSRHFTINKPIPVDIKAFNDFLFTGKLWGYKKGGRKCPKVCRNFA